MWNSFIPDMKDFSRLSPGWDFQFLIAIQRGNVDFCTQHSLRDVNIQVQQDIILTALEELMRSYIQDEEQASIWPAVGSRVALPCQADLSPAIHAGGDLDFLFYGLA